MCVWTGVASCHCQVTVYDLWQHATLPTVYNSEYVVEVPSHSVNYVVFTKQA